jgi:tetratricopeptide (TPR) repeat protein
MDLSQTQTAIDYAEKALVIVRDLQERDKESYILCNLGLLYGYQGRVEAALANIEQALQIARDLDDREGEGVNLANLAELLIDANRYAEALERAAEAEKIGTALNSPEILSISNYAAGLAALVQGDLAGARAAVERGLSTGYEANTHSLQALYGVIGLRIGDRNAAQKAFDSVIQQVSQGTTESQDLQNAYGLALCGQALLGDGTKIAEAVAVFRKTHQAAGDAGIRARDKRLIDALIPVDAATVLTPVIALFANGTGPAIPTRSEW